MEFQEFHKPIRSVSKLAHGRSLFKGSWEALGAGAPVLVALAQLTSQAMIDPPSVRIEDLSHEARAILYAAHLRGMIEIKGSHTAFEAPSRMLAVYIDLDETQTIGFRDPNDPELTIRFLEGFRQLCAAGLVIHHSHRDFSLSTRGYAMARMLSKEEVQPWLIKVASSVCTIRHAMALWPGLLLLIVGMTVRWSIQPSTDQPSTTRRSSISRAAKPRQWIPMNRIRLIRLLRSPNARGTRSNNRSSLSSGDDQARTNQGILGRKAACSSRSLISPPTSGEKRPLHVSICGSKLPRV